MITLIGFIFILTLINTAMFVWMIAGLEMRDNPQGNKIDWRWRFNTSDKLIEAPKSKPADPDIKRYWDAQRGDVDDWVN